MVFLTDLSEESTRQSVVPDRFEFCMEQFARPGIERNVQLVALVLESDHGFIDCDVIRHPVGFGL